MMIPSISLSSYARLNVPCRDWLAACFLVTVATADDVNWKDFMESVSLDAVVPLMPRRGTPHLHLSSFMVISHEALPNFATFVLSIKMPSGSAAGKAIETRKTTITVNTHTD